MINVISFGAGVQTTALAILTAQGKVDNPGTALVFADTGDEKPETYAYLDNIFKPYAERVGLPFHIVKYQGNVSLYEYAWRYQMVPSVLRRWCTSKFKIQVINRWLREQGATRRHPAIVQIGISADEAHRAVDRDPRLYIHRIWPLVEMGISRQDCLNIIRDAGLPPPVKSGCWYCPFQAQAQWKRLATDKPELFTKALALEERAMQRNPRDFLGASIPLRRLIGEGRQLNFDKLLEDEAGCNSGYCFA